MKVWELIKALRGIDEDLPVHVMGDNGCRDPGYAEAKSTYVAWNEFEKKDIFYIESDE